MKRMLCLLASRDTGPVLQFIKYGVAGGAATAVHIVVFQFCAAFVLACLDEKDLLVRLFGAAVPAISDATRGWRSAANNGIAFMLSNLTAYILNRQFVFKPGRHHWLVEVGLFYAVSGLSLVIGTTIMTWLIQAFGVRTDFAFGANIVSAVLINYAMRKFVIFHG